MGKVKLAFAVSDLRLRTDLRDLIVFLNKKCGLTVYIKSGDLPYLPAGVSYAIIDQRTRHPWYKIFALLYTYGGRPPKPDSFYRLYIKRRNQARKASGGGAVTWLKIHLVFLVSGLISYKKFLKSIGRNLLELHQFDVFLGITNSVDNQLYADVRTTGIPAMIYLTSWDHPPKFREFCTDQFKYLTWSSALSDDLQLFHDIPITNTKVVGSGQFTYLYDYLNIKKRAESTEKTVSYIYAIGTFAYPDVARQEVQVIVKLCEKLAIIHPDWYVLFRPYPILHREGVYQELELIDNLVFEDVDFQQGEVLFNREDIIAKYKTINESVAVFHTGTTMGMEAAYFDVPILCIAGDSFDDLSLQVESRISKSLSQYHVDKYFILGDYPNIIRNEEDFIDVLRMLSKPECLLDYNIALRKFIDLRSSQCFQNGMLAEIQETAALTEVENKFIKNLSSNDNM